ncbi:MAG: creatininase family protein [Saprospiraceae bacterium]
MENWALFHESRPDQITNIKKKYPIAYIPWGALEYHSYHNPTGLDGIKAFGLCCDLAMAIGGLVFPTIYQASNLIKSYPGVHFPDHSIEFTESLIRMTCEEYFDQLVQDNFKIIICISGHAGEPHLSILKDVSNKFSTRFQELRFWTIAEFDILSPDILVANHSALGETSLQLHYAPETVDLTLLPLDRPTSLELDGISGTDPKTSSEEIGLDIKEKFLNEAKPIIEQFLKDIKLHI